MEVEIGISPNPFNRGAVHDIKDASTITRSLELDERWGQSCWLYRYFGFDGGLLYVGIAQSLAIRDERHWQQSRWRSSAELIQVELFPDRRLAEFAEGEAIAVERPPHNVRQPHLRASFALVPLFYWYLDKHRGDLVGEHRMTISALGPDCADMAEGLGHVPVSREHAVNVTRNRETKEGERCGC